MFYLIAANSSPTEALSPMFEDYLAKALDVDVEMWQDATQLSKFPRYVPRQETVSCFRFFLDKWALYMLCISMMVEIQSYTH